MNVNSQATITFSILGTEKKCSHTFQPFYSNSFQTGRWFLFHKICIHITFILNRYIHTPCCKGLVSKCTKFNKNDLLLRDKSPIYSPHLISLVLFVLLVNLRLIPMGPPRQPRFLLRCYSDVPIPSAWVREVLPSYLRQKKISDIFCRSCLARASAKWDQ